MRLIGLQVVKTDNDCRETLGFSYVLFTLLNSLDESHPHIINVSTLANNRETTSKDSDISIVLR